MGRRTASRIVLDLKGKVESYDSEGLPGQASDDVEVIAALTALGYSNNEARRAVANMDRGEELTLEDRIRLVLQRLGGA